MNTARTNNPVDMTKFMEWAAKFPRKFEVADLQRQPRLVAAAVEYARSYRGNFAYMVDMRQAATQGFLTLGQAKGVLNCARAEAIRNTGARQIALPESKLTKAQERERSWSEFTNREEARFDALLEEHGIGRDPGFITVEQAPVSVATADFLPHHSTPRDGDATLSGLIENATYTVVFDRDSDDRITIKVSDPKWLDEGSSNKQQVSYLFGPENTTDYKGVGFISDGTTLRFWKRFNEAGNGDFAARIIRALEIIAEGDRDEYRQEYALRSGRCARCGRKLTVPASIHRGLGPECATKI